MLFTCSGIWCTSCHCVAQAAQLTPSKMEFSCHLCASCLLSSACMEKKLRGAVNFISYEWQQAWFSNQKFEEDTFSNLLQGLKKTKVSTGDLGPQRHHFTTDFCITV